MSSNSKSRKIMLKKNKDIDKIWHADSTLVFKSSKEKLVIGRCQNGVLIPLDNEALELCVTWKLKYDPECIKKESEEEAEEEAEEEEAESEEEEESEEESEEEVKKEVKKEVNINCYMYKI